MSNPRLLLTFSTPFPPTKVKIGFTVHTVRIYIKHPRRCFKCHKFGHPSKYCRSPQSVCPRCGSTLHTSCEHPPCCPNCKGSHIASSVDCPSFLLEKEILEQMTINKLDRREATPLSKEKRSHHPFSFATAPANRSAPTAQRSNRNRASTASRAPPRTPPRPRSDAVAVTGTAIHTIQANCPPHSPKIVRAHARSKSPVHTSVSHGVSTVEVHAPPRSARSSPVSDPSREMEVCPSGSINIDSS